MTTALTITGATRLYAIVGDPIAQVRSPEVFTERFAAAALDAVLVPAHVPAGPLRRDRPGAAWQLRNLDGLLVTVPFKARMLRFAQRSGPAARSIGASTRCGAKRTEPGRGDMFDGAGFVRGVERKGQRLRGRRVALFGAGGAGSAIACALAERRCRLDRRHRSDLPARRPPWRRSCSRRFPAVRRWLAER